jgi:hypothetical protein
VGRFSASRVSDEECLLSFWFVETVVVVRESKDYDILEAIAGDS